MSSFLFSWFADFSGVERIRFAVFNLSNDVQSLKNPTYPTQRFIPWPRFRVIPTWHAFQNVSHQVSKFLDPNQVELESDVWRQSNKNLIPTLFQRQWMSLFLPYQPKNCDFYSISYRCAFSPFSTVVVVVVVYAALKFVNT